MLSDFVEGIDEKFVITEDGTKIRYITSNHSDTERTLIFIHGMGGRLEVWKYQISEFSKDLRVIALDLRGFGESEIPDDLTSISDFVKDINAVMNVENVKKAVICGISMGGIAAMSFYNCYPNRVSALVLADTTAQFPEDMGRKAIRELEEFVDSHGMEYLAENIVETSIMSKDEKDLELIKACIKYTDKEYYKKAFRTIFYTDVRNVLPEISIPVAVLVGEFDSTTPIELSQHLTRNIEDSKFFVIKNAAHASEMENPVEFNRILREFLTLKNF